MPTLIPARSKGEICSPFKKPVLAERLQLDQHFYDYGARGGETSHVRHDKAKFCTADGAMIFGNGNIDLVQPLLAGRNILR